MAASEARLAGLQNVSFRRLGDETVLFDSATWSTHVLNPAASALLDVVLALGADQPAYATAVAAATEVLECAPDDPALAQSLQILVDAGLVRPAHAAEYRRTAA